MAVQPVVLITGVGPGTGAAAARRFTAGGYRVAMFARGAARLKELEAELPGSRAFVCDVGDAAAVDAAVTQVTEEMGAPEVLIHNAVGGVSGSESIDGVMGNFLEIEPASLEYNFKVNTMALLHLSRRLAPAMIEAGRGAILVTGNTSALRGKAGFSAFAPTKAAQRVLSESMARHLGPKGVHVSYVVIDAVIDVPWTRRFFAKESDDFFIKPVAIADELWHVAHQDRSAWSFNVEIRPFRESW
ncbi:NADP-dependent 3-hydroxy acid dehydrogenase YdfG [Panacagrimonas perspica]|uniref:NADP-dependent 3-hydroxy acid dehydrogenase YdfG n=1 Tax=Panacagrimonas perspica TaxID=381431 RepID=A0A4R7PEM5_9GAMM|nr:SDR family NAD(P)-dependent oxidoreductase [Panacagrimonas perspica]TDU32567.1 NADP-dependent 3-hydroxy acid dehydrogenase YdfG [Panacagrimonas perspica]THD05467.1 short-chain dehydrogenase [Panacagrimonas perspica]